MRVTPSVSNACFTEGAVYKVRPHPAGSLFLGVVTDNLGHERFITLPVGRRSPHLRPPRPVDDQDMGHFQVSGADSFKENFELKQKDMARTGRRELPQTLEEKDGKIYVKTFAENVTNTYVFNEDSNQLDFVIDTDGQLSGPRGQGQTMLDVIIWDAGDWVESKIEVYRVLARSIEKNMTDEQAVTQLRSRLKESGWFSLYPEQTASALSYLDARAAHFSPF